MRVAIPEQDRMVLNEIPNAVDSAYKIRSFGLRHKRSEFHECRSNKGQLEIAQYLSPRRQTRRQRIEDLIH